MGEVIQFPKANDNKKIKSIIEKSIDTLKDTRKNNPDLIDDIDFMLNYLEGYDTSVLKKVNDYGWKTQKNQDRFIEVCDEINEDKSDKVDNMISTLVLTYITDLCPRILYNDYEFIDATIDSLTDYIFETEKIDDDLNKDFLHKINLPILKEVIDYDDNMYLSSNLYDILSMLESNMDISSIVSIFNEPSVVDDLKTGIIDITRLKNYYLKQLDFFYSIFINSEDDKLAGFSYFEYQEAFEKIDIINKYDSKSKTLFIYYLKDIINSNISLIEQFKYVKALTEIYLLKGEKFKSLNEDNFYSYIDEKIKEDKKKGLNYEDRRF